MKKTKGVKGSARLALSTEVVRMLGASEIRRVVGAGETDECESAKPALCAHQTCDGGLTCLPPAAGGHAKI
jgi:hypothetical protein